MAEYSGSIDLIGGLKQKNNGTFALMNASAVQVDDDDKRLDTALDEKYDASKLRNFGIKSITWSVSRSEITVTTVEDPYKSQRPSGTNTRYWAEFAGCPYFKNRNTYRVTFNGTVYDNLVCDYGILVNDGSAGKHASSTDSDVGGAWQLIGNKNLFDSRYESTGEPFCIIYIEHGGMNTDSSYYYGYTVGHGCLFTSAAGSNKLKIETATITQDELPKSLFNNYGYGDRTYQNISSSTYPRTSIGAGNIVGRGGVAVGTSCTATGYLSYSEGQGCKSSGSQSHSEGNRSEASGGYGSHAEGSNSIASGVYSHSEGHSCKASGIGSHAEGNACIASGDISHAQGNYSYAKGVWSFSYGSNSNASGDASACGGRGSISKGKFSYAHGLSLIIKDPMCFAYGVNNLITEETGKTVSYTIYDEDEKTALGTLKATLGKYAHIVGNGTSDTARSNAHTLDWDGNAWYAGTVEGTSMIIKSPNGTRWQISVDDDGVLTSTKVVE